MVKKKTNRLVESWTKLASIIRILIIWALCLVVVVSCTVKPGDFDSVFTKEENYVALEQVIYDIVETKNITQPLDENLTHYYVTFNADNTIDLVLHTKGTGELDVTLTEDYQIRKMIRKGNISNFFRCVYMYVYFGVGYNRCNSSYYLYDY